MTPAPARAGYWQANSADTRMGAPISYEEFTRRTGMPLLSAVICRQHKK
jgi:hypothetical protein